MVNCKSCGGAVDDQSKFCPYCGNKVNEQGKDYANGGEAFKITGTFKVSNRAMILGKPLQYIKVGDVLFLGDKDYKVWNMQKGNSIVSNVGPNDTLVGIAFEDFNIKGLKEGQTLCFKE